MNVHQMSVAYVPEQDRILARVNTREAREISFWLTRKLALGLAPLMDKVVSDHAARRGGLAPSHIAGMDELARKAISQFQSSATLKSADFATPYKTPEAGVALFEHPLLVTEVNVTALNNDRLQLSFSEKLAASATQRSFQLALSDQLVHAFVLLLERALVQSRWRDGPAAGAQAATAPGERSTTPDKPGYLN